MKTIFSAIQKLCLSLVIASMLVACGGGVKQGSTAASVSRGKVPTSAMDYYLRGQEQVRAKDLVSAAKTLDEMETKFPLNLETGELYAELIEGYYNFGQADAAIATTDRFVKMFPSHKNVVYANYLAAMADYERGRKNISMDVTTSDPTYAKAALARFKGIVACCDNNEYAFNAKQYIYHLESMISLYELRYMGWDYDSERIDAAAQRGISLLVTYPDSVAAKRARMMLASHNFDEYRAEINRAIREAHPVMPVQEVEPEVQPVTAEQFTIRVASDSSLLDLEKRVESIGLADEVEYYRNHEYGESYYFAAYGKYSDHDKAKSERLHLRVRTEVPEMWVHNLDNSEPVTNFDEIIRTEREAIANAPKTSLTPVAVVAPVVKKEPLIEPPKPESTHEKPAKFYAVQVMSFAKLDRLKKAVASMGLTGEVGLYSHMVKGTQYFIALYGNYPSWSAGKNGLVELEQKTGKSGYWLRKVDPEKVRPAE